MPESFHDSSRLTPASRFKAKIVGDEGGFTGYASTFNGEPDAFGDIVRPGAFTETLKLHKSRGTSPALLWGHDLRNPVGKILSLQEDRSGLLMEGKLTLGTTQGAEAYALMKDDVLGLSIGYNVPEGGREYRGDGTYHVKRIDLGEVSLVSVPANHNARILTVKSVRNLRRVLQDTAGFSSREAEHLAEKLWPALTGEQNDDSAELQTIASAIDQSTRDLLAQIERV